MKLSFKNILSALTIFPLISSLVLGQVYAQDMNSSNYKLIDVTIDSGGGQTTSLSNSYQLLGSIGDFSSDPRFSSPSYKLKGGIGELFMANVPLITCFETTTDGTSQCLSAPSYIKTGGMTKVCGPTGCYDRARVEIDPQLNPSDTLYGLQISTTSDFTSNVWGISGSSFMPIAMNSRTINDYLTQTDWDTPTFNVIGLAPNTNYWIRATALHGDFTESDPGPTQTAKTSVPYLYMDIDIADTTGSPASNAPYKLNMTLAPGLVKKADKLIWVNSGTNLRGGEALFEYGLNGGLKKNSNMISSSTTDLTTAQTGFGLQHYSVSQQYDTGNGGELSTLSVVSQLNKTYNGATENVVQIPQTPTIQKAYDSTGPISNGKSAMYVMGKASASTPADSYSETITFVLVANY